MDLLMHQSDSLMTNSGRIARFGNMADRILSQFDHTEEDLQLPLDNTSECGKNTLPPSFFNRTMSPRMPLDARIYVAVEKKPQSRDLYVIGQGE
jgi:hypothetical protein